MAGIARVTDSLLSNQTLRSLQGNLRTIAEENRRISTGQKYAVPSDAPLSVRRLITWQRTVERNEKYTATIQFSKSQLSATESAMDEMQQMIVRARDIALEQLNATSNAETRAGAAVEVEQLVSEAVTLGNRKFGDRYLFAGTQVTQPPFERVGNYVSYRGDDAEPVTEIAPGMRFEASISGVRAFGGYSTEIAGRVDLDPILTVQSKLSTFNNGRGVDLGSIELRDGIDNPVLVDLSQAKTIGDVISTINASGYATATFKADSKGLQISKAGANLSVLDVNGGKTATDLGIAKLGMGVTLAGDDVDPVMGSRTPLSQLREGLGIDLTGFTLTNGNLSASIDLSGAVTVEDVMNSINSSGAGVHARLASDGRSLELLSTLAGADLIVSEGVGTTATELGLVMSPEETPLARLHGGRGVQALDGGDFTITLGNGNTLALDVSDADTLADVITLINNHPDNGGLVTASAATGPVQLVLTDLSGGPAEMTVSPINGSFAASGLGIAGTSVASVLTGSDLNPGGIRLQSAFDGFGLLYEGLASSDPVTLRRALEALDGAEERLLHARGTVGGRLQRLEISERRTQLDTLEFQELISLEGDADIAESIVNYQRAEFIYQAALQTSAGLLQNSLLDFLSI